MSVSYNQIKIRATIDCGGTSISTPYIMSFNVNRARGQMFATFQASVKVESQGGINIGGQIKISAGRGSAGNLIFTGYIHELQVNPCREDSDYVIVSMSGKDIMFALQGQHYTRRSKATSMSRFGVITSIVGENQRYKERFPAKIYSSSERLISSQIMNDEGQIISAPSPSMATVDGTSLGSSVRFIVSVKEKSS